MITSPSHDEKLAQLREIIKATDFCMLTTIDEHGDLHSRPMSNNKDVEFDGDLWFFTSSTSHKADEIGHIPKVNASFADVRKQRYASVSGHAALVRDPDKIKEFWHPIHRAWFPQGVDTPDLALLRVTVEKAEYWEGSGSKIAQAIGLVTAIVKGKTAALGENERLNL